MGSQIEKLNRLKRSYGRGEYLFREGEPSHDLYILLEGEVTVSKNDEKIAVINKQGSYIGEMSALNKEVRSASCICTRSCEVICVPEDSLESFFAAAPQMGFKLAVMLAGRLSKMNEKYLELKEEVD